MAATAKKAQTSREAGKHQELALTHARLEEVPLKFCDLVQPTLLSLDLSGNEIQEIPPKVFSNLSQLESLAIQNNKLVAIPSEIRALKRLKTLRLDKNLLSILPQAIGELPSLVTLSLARNSLLTLPMSISGLSKTLSFLCLSSNSIKFLPPEMGDLIALSQLYLDHNKFCALPASLTKCVRLEEFSLDWLCYTSYAVSHVKGEALKNVMAALGQIAQRDHKSDIDAMDAIVSMSDGPFDSNAKDVTNGRSWLHMAARHDHTSVIQSLLRHGSNPNALDKNRYSPMCLAIKHNNMDSARMLLEAGANIDIGGGPFGTALHMAVIKCELWLVKALISRGADVNAPDEQTLNTPLHQLFANFDRSPCRAASIAEALLVSGAANPNAKNLEGWAPIHIAARKGQSKAIKWIVQTSPWLQSTTGSGFDLSLAGGAERWTALHLAGHYGHYKLVQVLAGTADLFAQNADFRTPRQASKGNLAICKLLRRAEVRATQVRLHYELPDKSEDGVGTRFNSPGKKDINHVADVFMTEAADLSPKTFGPGKFMLLVSDRGKPCETERQNGGGLVRLPYSNSRTYRERSINAFYLRDKILNNLARLHERYDALNTLRGSKNSAKVFAEILKHLGSIQSQALQLEVIQTASVIRFPESLQILEGLKVGCARNSTLRKEIESALELAKNSARREVSRNSAQKFLSASTRFPQGGLLGGIQKDRASKYFNEL